jgi:transglutaminase/protease-like cytokinesis protein 3
MLYTLSAKYLDICINKVHSELEQEKQTIIKSLCADIYHYFLKKHKTSNIITVEKSLLLNQKEDTMNQDMSTLVHNLLFTRVRNNLLMMKQLLAVYINVVSIKYVK